MPWKWSNKSNISGGDDMSRYSPYSTSGMKKYDKPLTLLNGGHLLHLLEKHGMKARIDIAQARKELGLTGKISKRGGG